MSTAAATNPGTSPGVAHDDTTDGQDDTLNHEDGADEESLEGDEPEDDGEEGEGEDGQDGEDGADGADGADPATPEMVEVEHDGEVFKVPAPLKEAFLRNADYTQKTQAIAEQRRDLENREQASRTHIKDLAALYNIHEQIEAYKQVDWDGLQAENPDMAATEWRKYQLLKDKAPELANNIRRSEAEAQALRDREHDTLLAQGTKVLQESIGWNPELAGKLAQYGTEKFGFTRAEIATVTDPRLFKLLHAAMTSEQKATTQRKVDKVLAPQKTRPVPQAKTGGSVPQTKDPSKMTPAQYRVWRENQG